ncbi:MAG TPA: DUF4214 domain-containing protein [Candidatus Dormibacteraeota bacterium]|nr:DUF4214 domain-containing protein [Candidatus Dormibacteraeota bacterium]
MRRRAVWIVALLGAALALGDGGVLPASAASAGYSSASICPVPRPGHATCMARVLTRAGQRVHPAVRGAVQPDLGPSGGLGPSEIASAYGLPTALPPGPVPTVAIVDAFHHVTITGSGNSDDDLAVYRSYYGLAPCTVGNGCFRKVDQWGGTNYPTTTDLGWDGEADLDIDAVSAVCPACRILFVESRSDSTDDLMTAVASAVAQGASEVSLSWGGSEDPGQTAYDPVFDHPGVAITAATGDNGYGAGASYPATSPYVTAVGGTTLTQPPGGAWTETAWSGGGSGCSAVEPKPAWQHDSLCTGRTTADVAAVADPSTGLDVYSEGGWHVFGGTSLATPIVAGMYALGGGEGAATGALPFYAAPLVHDITTGNNGPCAPAPAALCTAGPGFDGPTGLGSPAGPPAPIAGATNANFVHSVYRAMLGRDPDPGSYTYWLGRLDGGTSRWTMTMALATSAEYRGDVIGGAGSLQGFYEEYLGRPSDPSGINYWIARMAQGTTFEQVRLAFIGSPEYFALHNDDPGQTIDALYHDVLGRLPDPNGRAYWIAHFNATTIASQILYSAEGRSQLVASYYQTYLGRAADAAGLAYWTQAILDGASDEQIVAFVVSSDEFFQTH